MDVALGKRTYGDFLDAGPSLQRRISRNSPEADTLWEPHQGRPILWVPHFSHLLREVGTLTVPGEQLLADAEFRNHGFIPLGIVFLEVVQQATALADQHEKAAARAVVFLVRLEVLRQLPNTLAEQGYLYFRAPGVAGMRAVLVNEGFLVLSG
jgi:hypothetical protein